MKRGGSRIMRVQPETWERARALYPAPPEVKVKPDDVIGYALDLAEQRWEGMRPATRNRVQLGKGKDMSHPEFW